MTRNILTQLLKKLERRLIRNRRRILRRNETPADIHAMRVDSRKLQAVLALQGAEHSKLYKATRKLTRRLGVVRDLDVQIERCDHKTGTRQFHGAKWHFEKADNYKTLLERKRHREAQNLRRYLQGKGGTKLFKRLSKQRRRQSGDQITPEVVQQQLNNRLKGFRKLATTLTRSSSDRQFHQVRISCKQLRYLVAAASAIGTTTPRRIRKQLSELQILLGEFQDTAVHQQLLRQYASSLPLTPENRHQLLQVGGVLERLYRAQSASRAIAVKLCRTCLANGIAKL